MPVLQAVGLKKSYATAAGRLAVLEGLDFSVEPEEMVAVVGASGVGKTTLLNLLGLMDQSEGGEIILDGEGIGKLEPEKQAQIRNRKFGFIFQFHHLLADFTAAENAAFPLLMRGEPKASALALASTYLARLGLSEKAGEAVYNLSGGEAQRVAVARALAGRPRVVFADEPTGNLDVPTAGELHSLFSELKKEGQTFVVATHNPELARRADRVLELKDRKLVQR
ncbi:MAG: ABC transporter ATP-binding protein [candidate division Zixibacteria bacterium]|nr:ABC transporter ATP-binding protein [candidate division Zixibacteria bacterium]